MLFTIVVHKLCLIFYILWFNDMKEAWNVKQQCIKGDDRICDEFSHSSQLKWKKNSLLNIHLVRLVLTSLSSRQSVRQWLLFAVTQRILRKLVVSTCSLCQQTKILNFTSSQPSIDTPTLLSKRLSKENTKIGSGLGEFKRNNLSCSG